MFGPLARLTVEPCPAVLTAALLAATAIAQSTPRDAGARADTAPAAPAPAVRVLGRGPLRFEANRGQASPDVAFVARGGAGYVALVAPTETRFVLRAADAPDGAREVRMEVVGGDADAVTEGSHELPGTANYFRGSDPEAWVRGAPTFARVECRGIYPGVDLVHRADGPRLAYDFVLSPGADPSLVRLAFDGCDRVELDAGGGLLLHVAGGTLAHGAPVIFQDVDGERRLVEGRFVQRSEREFGFEVSGHDPSRTLVIDPTVTLSRFLGGGGDDFATGVATDGAGNVYVSGYADSLDFPGGALPAGGTDAYVVKLDPTGTTVLYSTFVGGSSSDSAIGMGLDGAGNAVLAGTTQSVDLPTTTGALQPASSGGFSDLFVVALDTSGGLAYASYLGGSGLDIATDVAIGPGGDAYVTGRTDSVDLPSTPGAFDGALDGAMDAFLAVVSPSGAGSADLEYLTYLGGGHSDRGWGVAIDSAGVAYLTGATTNEPNNPPTFPTTPDAYRDDIRLRNNVFFDSIFITKLDPAGGGASDLVYSTFVMRDPGLQSGRAIAADDFGRAYVTGTCHKKLPTTEGAFDATYNGGKFYALQDTFVLVLDTNVAGTAGLEYGTYLGGYMGETPSAIAVRDASTGAPGEFHVAGILINDTPHPNDNDVLPFPTTPDAFQTATAGFGEGYLCRFQPAGNGAADLVFSTLVGGAGREIVRDLAFDGPDRILLAGETESADLVPVPGNAHAGGGHDGFVLGVEYASTGDPPDAPTDLVATAVSSGRIDLAWTDNAVDEAGFDVERSSGGSGWSVVASPGPDATSHSDVGLAAATEYSYRVRAWNAAGSSAYSNVASATTESGSGGGDAVATGEIAVAGTVTGSFTDTHADDGVYESIRERETNGNPSTRYSYLEHKWTFEVPAGSSVSLHLKAYHSISPDGDDFVFAYSSDDSTYTDALTVTRTVDDGTYQTATLPGGLSGTVYVRVRDTDRVPGHRDKDTVYVDHVFVRSE